MGEWKNPLRYMASIFTKIIKGEIPCLKIYETDKVLAFLDIHPVQLGHTLIVPKMEVDSFLDVPEPYYSAVFEAAQVVGKAIQKATGSTRVGTMILGFDVPHFHYHLIPIWQTGDMDLKKAKTYPEETMKEIQKKIQSNLI